MTPTETAALLRQYNQGRRGNLEGQPQPDPRKIGEAIEVAIAMIDRLEGAESDALEQARLNGMGASREAALMAKLEAAEKSDAESLAMYRKARDERDALRAKIEAMERQEPVAWCTTDETETVVEALGMNKSRRFDTALYLAPGAKGEEK